MKGDAIMLPIPFANPGTYPGHSGVDFPQPGGTPVPASADGVVVNRGWGSRSGYFVEVQYDNGPKVFSCHFPSLHAVPAIGTRVRRGTTVGVVGTTGNSTGNHLHQEVDGYASTSGYWKFHTASDVVAGGRANGNLTSRGTEEIQRRIGADPDGIWGDDTDKKVRAFQRANGLEPDGLWGVLTDAKAFPAKPVPPASSGSGGSGYDGAAVAGVHGPNPFGIPFTGGLQKIARLYGYSGALDQHWGDGVTSGSMGGFVQFLRVQHGYVGNNELGPVMWAAIARWLRKSWGYVGNDVPGPDMRKALLRADTANWAEL